MEGPTRFELAISCVRSRRPRPLDDGPSNGEPEGDRTLDTSLDRGALYH